MIEDVGLWILSASVSEKERDSHKRELNGDGKRKERKMKGVLRDVLSREHSGHR